jgi:hypothetical protein
MTEIHLYASDRESTYLCDAEQVPVALRGSTNHAYMHAADWYQQTAQALPLLPDGCSPVYGCGWR